MEETSTRIQLACRNTCKHAFCTGKGSESRWAHRCQLIPADPQLAPVLTRADPIPSPVPSPSRHRTPHQYGQHDPSTAPATVKVLSARRWPETIERPLPVELIRQRAAVNQLAHEASRP